MTVYELCRKDENDFDFGDDTFDAVVTVCLPDVEEDDEEADPYDRFCLALAKKVKVLEVTSDCCAVADWTGYILKNIAAFRIFAKEHWCYETKHTDNLVYKWIEEFHALFSGYAGNNYYNDLLYLIKCTVGGEEDVKC